MYGSRTAKPEPPMMLSVARRIGAIRSCKQQELEDKLEAIKRERDLWKDRALGLKGQIMQLGFPEPFREE